MEGDMPKVRTPRRGATLPAPEAPPGAEAEVVAPRAPPKGDDGLRKGQGAPFGEAVLVALRGTLTDLCASPSVDARTKEALRLRLHDLRGVAPPAPPRGEDPRSEFWATRRRTERFAMVRRSDGERRDVQGWDALKDATGLAVATLRNRFSVGQGVVRVTVGDDAWSVYRLAVRSPT